VNEGDPETWQALRSMLMREQYGSRPMFPRSASWTFQFGMFFRYFFEQYVLSSRLGALGGVLPVAVGLFGAILHAARHKKTFVVQATTVFLTSVGLLVYLNFTDHEVRERDYFYTSAFHFFSIWIGMGMAFGIEWLRERWPVFQRRAVLGLSCAAAVAVSLLPAAHHWYAHDRRGFFVARDYAHNMLAPLAPHAFLFTNGDNDTFPLWYIQQVEGFRRDVRVINLSLLNTDWYVKQLRDEEPRVPMTITDDELIMARDYGALLNPVTGQPEAVNHVMVLNILEANRGRLPGYLAVTVPDHHGLDSLLANEGLVFRIERPGFAGRPGLMRSGANWADVQALRRNLYERFLYRGLFDERGEFLERPYKDENARRLTQNYANAHMQLAYDYKRRGQHEQAIAEVERILRMFPGWTQIEGFLGVFILEAGDTARALEYFRHLARTRPSADAYYYYGLALAGLGETDSAVASFLSAVRLDPRETQSYKAAYVLLMSKGRVQEAQDVLRELIEKHPDDPEVQEYMAQADSTGRRGWAGPGAGGSTPGGP
jgi:TolA-binding protein